MVVQGGRGAGGWLAGSRGAGPQGRSHHTGKGGQLD